VYGDRVVTERFKMLAGDAARLALGGRGRGDSPPAAWLIHLAERSAALAPAAPRTVLVTWPACPPRTGGVPYPRDVTFGPTPAELGDVTRHPAPSWWVVELDNVFLLSRDAVEQIAAVGSGDGPAGGGGVGRDQPRGSPGRPIAAKKVRIVRRLRELRGTEPPTPWKTVYQTINEEFGTEYVYSRSGTLQVWLRESQQRGGI
jgi:hypothetical protein